MKKMNKIFMFGLLIIGITLLIERFTELPDIIYGFLFGIGVTCEVIGIFLDSKNRFK